MPDRNDPAQDTIDRWSATFDAITDIVCVVSKDNVLLAVNEAACAALGKTREELVGRKCFECIHNTTSPITDCPCNTVATTLEPATTLHEQNGATFELSAWPIFNPENQLEAFVHVVKDVTDEKRAHEHLKLTRALIDQSGDAIEVLDPDTGQFLDVNERGCLDLGYTREEYCSLTVFDVDPMVDPATFAGVVKTLRRDGSLTWDGTHRRKDGSTFPVEVNIRYVRLDRPYLVAAVRDVTEKRKAEALIRRTRDTQEIIARILRLSLEDSPLEVLLQKALQAVLSIPWLETERKGAIFLTQGDPPTLVMKAAEGLAAEVMERCASVRFGHCLCGRAASSRELVYAEQVDSRHETTYAGMVPHGHYCVPIAFQGKVLGVLNTYFPRGHAFSQEDVDFLTDVANTLAGIIVRRQAEEDRVRAEEQLRQAQRLKAIGRLAGGVAHDFNNLLSVIISYADFVADELTPSAPAHADVVQIRKAGERAAALTRQLLAFSRKQVLEPEVLNLNTVVSGIERMLRRLLGEDIDIRVHLLPTLPSVLADAGQIEQVIMNLAVNARDAMPHGGRLTIETAAVELDAQYADQHVAAQPGPYVMLSVADTGFGMDEETRQHIFEPFYTTKGKNEGTGLGLATVYGIVKQSGGNIWVYSEPGHGTIFKVYLPAVDAPARGSKSRPTPRTAGGSETILVVEDETAVRRLAERILRHAGHTVLTASNGTEALQVFEHHDGDIDLLLTDVVMPRMSGRELAERLAVSSPKTRVLYMSGYTDNAIVHHGVLDPGLHFIGKPFAAAELTRKVREILDATGKTRGES